MADNANQEKDGSVLSEAAAPVKDVAKEATQTVTSEMKKVAREAAIVVLTPVVKKAATSVAKNLAVKGPELFQDYVAPKIEDAGGIGNLAKQATGEKGLKGMAVGKAAEGVMGKLTGGSGGGQRADGTGRGRRLPVQASIDVGVPIEVAYNEWTQFENFPKFMHRVEQIEQIDDTHLVWHENIWGRRRKWKAEITDQTPDERISWRSEDGTQTAGVVTFHDLGDRLTRILVNLDFQPKGVVEKTASGFRMSRRALTSDLMRFKAYVEMKDEEDDAWRGTIEDGEVVDYDEEYDPEEAREEIRGRRHRVPVDEQDDQDDEQSDEYDEYEDDEEPEEQSDEYEDEADEDEPEEQSDEYEDDEDEPEEQSDEYEDEADEDESEEQSDEYEDEADEDEPEEQSDEYEDDEEPEDQADELDEDQGDEEPEEEPAPPRRRRARAASTPSRTARKATSQGSRTAKKAASSGSRTAKKATSRGSRTAKKASGTAKKATGSSRTAKKAASSGSRTAKKAASSGSRTAKKASSSGGRTAKKTASRTTKKATSSRPAKKAASTARKSASGTRKRTSSARKSTSGRSR